jgi:hypothetical protein
MPSTIVKLSSGDARAWAHNQPVWLHETGEVARPVTREEQSAISRALERSRKIDHNFRLALPLHPVQPRANRRPLNGSPPQLSISPAVMECAFEVVIIGRKRVVTVFHGNLRYALGREVLAARLLADHGECVLHGRNGKCMAVLRDPLIHERAPNFGRRVQFSRNPDEQTAAEQALRHADQTPQQRQTVRARFAGASKPLYSPEQCPNDCRGRRGGGEWALAKGARPPTAQEHHPVCKHAAAWSETLEGIATNAVLYDLELGTIARTALPNEITEADESEARTGIRQITVAGRLFAVLPTEEAEQASLEAHGEGTDDPESDPVPPRRPLGRIGNLSPSSPDLGDLPLEDTEAPDLTLGSLAVLIDPPGSLAADIAAGASTTVDSHSPAAVADVRSTKEVEREAWPSLDATTPAEKYRQRAEVTAQRYLARTAPLVDSLPKARNVSPARTAVLSPIPSYRVTVPPRPGSSA